MAFPLDRSHVLQVLRSTPLPSESTDSQHLPPITFQIARHLHHHIEKSNPRQAANVSRHFRRLQAAPVISESPPDDVLSISPSFKPVPMPDRSLLTLDAPTLAELLTLEEVTEDANDEEKTNKFTISKFFQKSQEDSSDSDIDDGEIRLIEDDDDVHTEIEVPPPVPPRRQLRRKSLELLVNSDFGVWVDRDGNPVRRIASNEVIHNELITGDSLDEFDDLLVLLDLAFTDIDALLMMQLLAFPDLFVGDLGAYDFGKRKKKTYSDTYSRNLTLSRPQQTSLASKQVTRERLAVTLRKLTLQFDKVEPRAPETSLALLGMIHAKFKTCTSNPLSYYAFANTAGTDKVKVDIFIYPSQKLGLTIEVNDNVVVVDLIGYILLKLVERGEKIDLINPNHWQLELVDEDGEDYGAFGLLNRTRGLASYNNPRYLALKQVTDVADQQKNDRETPLAMEFKNNLAELQVRRTSAVGNTVIDGDASVLLRVLASNEMNFMYVRPDENMGTILKEFCARENLDYNHYRFREVDISTEPNKVASLLLPVQHKTTATGRMLNDDDPVALVAHSAVELVTARKDNLQIITPGLYMITPNPSELQQQLAVTLTPKVATKPPVISRHRKTSTKVSLDDFFKQTEPQSNLLGALWYKWQVWRKKPPMPNKFAKLLIIDGDYIHLAPLEEQEDADPLASHDHYHLSHYNYTKFYKQMLNKTSSFHVAHLLKVKQDAKHASNLKLVVKKVNNEQTKDIKKRYYLEAESEHKCKDIIDKLHYAQQMYSLSQLNN